MTYLITTLLLIGPAMLIGCKKSPKELLNGSKTLPAKSINHFKDQKNQDQEPATEHRVQRPKEAALSPETPKTTRPSKDHRLCFKLLRKFHDEPHFYQLQANLREFSNRGKDHELVIAHMRYHKISDKEGELADKKKHTREAVDCAQIILGFERFQNVEKLDQLSYEAAHDTLEKRIMSYNAQFKKYPLSACSNVIGSIESSEELQALQYELSRSHSGQTPYEIIAALLEAHPGSKQETANIKITARGCVAAIQSFWTYQRLRQFVAANKEQQTNIIGPFGSYY